MYFELQFSAPLFARMLENQLKANKPCFGYMEFQYGEQTVVLDSVDIVDPLTIQRQPSTPADLPFTAQIVSQYGSIGQITAPYLQVRPSLQVNLMLKSDLVANQANPTAPWLSPKIQPVYNVSALIGTVAADGTLVPANVGAGGPVVVTYVLDQLPFDSSLPIPAADQATLHKALAGINIAAATLDFSQLFTNLQLQPMVAINCGITCNPTMPASVVALRIEVKTSPDSYASFQDFFVSGPLNRLDGHDFDLFVSGDFLAAQTQTIVATGLANSLNVDVTAAPQADWNGSGIDLTFSGTALDACPVTNGDIDFDAKITATITIPETDQIRTHLHMDFSPSNFFQVAECAATTALLWPFIDLDMVGEGQFNIAQSLGGLMILPLVTFIGAIFAIETMSYPGDLSSQLGHNFHKIDDDDYESDDTLDPKTLLLSAFNAQLEFDSSSSDPDGLVFSGAITNIQDYTVGSFSVGVEPFAWRVTGNCQTDEWTGINFAKITVALDQPPMLCSVQLIGDSAQHYVAGPPNAVNEVTITPKLSFSGVFKGQLPTTPCVVAVVTTEGVRIITLAPPQPETPNDVSIIQKDSIIAKGNCIKLTRQFSVLDKIHWIPDPPRESGYLQSWHIQINNVNRQIAELRSDRGDLLLKAHAPSSGILQMMLLLDPPHAAQSLSLSLNGHSIEPGATLHVQVQQTLFVHAGTVPAPDALTGLSFVRGAGGAKRLIVESSRRSSRWNLRSPGTPLLEASQFKTPGQVSNAVHGSNGVSTALTDLARTALDSVWAQEAERTIVGTPTTAGFDRTLYLGSRSKGSLFDITNPQKPVAVQVFHSAPWFVGTAWTSKMLARQNVSSGTVEIYRVKNQHLA
jgi:hypothetical protein